MKIKTIMYLKSAKKMLQFEQNTENPHCNPRYFNIRKTDLLINYYIFWYNSDSVLEKIRIKSSCTQKLLRRDYL